MSLTKPLSGSAKRKLRKEREALEQKLQQARNDSKDSPKEIEERAALKYSDLPHAPLDEPEIMVSWASKVLAVTMDQIMRDKFMADEQRWKFLMEGCAKLGMIRDKASEQHSIKKILLAQQHKKEGNELTHVSVPPTPTVSRPSG